MVAVVTQPDRPVGRKKIITPSPVKEAAVKHGLPVLQPEKISGSAEMEEIIALRPDAIITAAFGQFLPEKLLQAPIFGAINVHASLLPKYRGRSTCTLLDYKWGERNRCHDHGNDQKWMLAASMPKKVCQSQNKMMSARCLKNLVF